jgi:hypothetical protein
VRDVDVVELAPRVGPAGDLVDRSAFVKMLEAGIGVGLERTAIGLEVKLRPFALAVRRVGEPHRRRGRIA